MTKVHNGTGGGVLVVVENGLQTTQCVLFHEAVEMRGFDVHVVEPQMEMRVEVCHVLLKPFNHV